MAWQDRLAVYQAHLPWSGHAGRLHLPDIPAGKRSQVTES